MSSVLPLVLLPREELEAVRARGAARLEDVPPPRAPEFFRGAVAALTWLLGEGLAPVSGYADGVTLRAVEAEESYADAAIFQRPVLGREPVNVPQDFGVGAQHALMWARGATDDPPC